MKVTDQRLRELERAEAKLNALELGGVDNWDAYDDVLEGWHAENDLEEKRENLINDLAEVFGECAYEASERGAGVAFNSDAYKTAMELVTKLGVTFEDGESE